MICGGLQRVVFLSVVQKPGEAQLTVRARVAADLDPLRERYVPSLSATVANDGTDYPFRARVSRKAFSEAMRPLRGWECFATAAYTFIPVLGPSGFCSPARTAAAL